MEERIVEAVQRYPCIYDKGHDGHKDKNMKALAWQEIADECNTSVTVAQTKFNSQRTKLSKYLKDLKNKSKSGK